MYYEEKLFDDVLMFRTTPDGQWRQVLVTDLSKRVVEQAKRIAELERQLALATKVYEETKETP